MKTRKTKKGNSIRRIVAFLLCMTMVLGLGMQDVMEQVYAEEGPATVQQDVQGTENNENGEQDSASEDPNETPSPTEEGDKAPENTPAPESETGSETPSDSSTPGQPADGQGSENGTGDGNTGSSNTGSDENSGNTGNTGNAGSTEQNNSQNTGNTSDGTQGSENGNTGSGNEDKIPAADGVENPDGSGSSDETVPVEDTETEGAELPVEEVPVSELTYAAEDGSFSVKAAAVSEDVDLSGIEIHAAQVQKDGEEADRYTAAEELVAGALDAESRRIEELQAYDIWFTYTESGETADLSGQVQISLEYTAPEFPEGTDAQLEVFCLNGGAAEAVDGTDALAAGCELYALAWAVPAESTDTWEWTDGQVIIKASADKGVLPEDAEISVTPIVKTEEEELADLSEEEKAEAEEINKKYEEAEQKLAEELKAEEAEKTVVQSAAKEGTADVTAESDEAANVTGIKTLEGFLAFDICFLVNGEEVEPAGGEVNVSIEFKNAAAPESVSDDAEVALKHLKEETAENGEKEIVVEDLTEAETTVIQKSEDSATVEKVELTTDSFSVFLITWSQVQTFGITVEARYVYIDEGKAVDIDPELVKADNIIISRADQIINLSDYQKEIPGYTRSRTVKDDAVTGDKVKRLKSSFTPGGWFTAAKWEIHASVSESGAWNFEPWLTAFNEDGKRAAHGYIYFVYAKTENDIKIQDDIINSGALKAVYTGSDGENITGYQWLRCEAYDGEYIEVENKAFNNNGTVITSISEDGTMLYPALDQGARQWYKVQVTFEDGTTKESVPLRVRYYDELENGGFENPVVDGSSNMQFGNSEYESLDGVWQSTGEITDSYHYKKVALEILNEQGDGAGAYSWIKDGDWKIPEGETADSGAAPEGSQFAELNAQAAGALYQDVLTVEGTTLNYSLQHRARGKNQNNIVDKESEIDQGGWGQNIDEYDTMYLVIMPTKEAIEYDLTTQDNLRKYLYTHCNHINIDQEYSSVDHAEVYNNPADGILVVRVTSNDEAWHSVSGVNYIPTAAATRFFFVAGDTESGNNTVGNFLDDVYFGQDLPPVADDEFSLEIQKKFEGLDNVGIERVKSQIQFKISAIKDREPLADSEVATLLGRESNTILGSEMHLAPDGTLSLVIANQRITQGDMYQITITELKAELDGYKMTPSVETSVQVGNDTPATETGDTTSTEFTLTGKTKATAVFTNSYDRSENKKVSFTKKWDDNEDAYDTRPQSLDVTLKATVEIANEDGVLVEQELDGKALGGIELTHRLTGEDWSTSWDVPVYYDHNGGKIKINYTVVEGDINSDYVYEATSEEALPGDGSDYVPQFDASDIVLPQTASVDSDANIENTGAKTALSAGVLSSSLETGSDGADDLGEPSHRKYVEYNRNTGDYTLNLDVTGAQGEASGVDILFVIDTSGSMGGYYSTLLSQVKNLLTSNGGIIDQIFAAEGNVNSVAYVSFAGKSETRASGWYQTDTKQELKNSINRLWANGGTNWTYAMQRASSTLAQRASSDNEKVVIFLSDGEPTYTMSGNRQTGSGSSTRDSYYEDASQEVINSSSLSKAKFYSVYLTNSTQDGMSTFNNKLVAGNVDAELKNGENLEQALSDILRVVIPTYKNVTIKDTLSQYVDFVDGTITVTAQAADGTRTTLSEGADYTKTVNEKTVEVVLLNGKSLTPGTTYTVSFRIKPNTAANECFAVNGYPDTGDAGTGVTSAGQEGFNSNLEGSAVVTYTVNEKEGSADYPMPVVQVTTHSLTFEKEWEKPSSVSVPSNEIQLTVNYTDGVSEQITLSAENDWSYTKNDVPVTRKIASVVENSEFEDYTPSYQISEDRTSVTVINNYSKIERQNITVTKVWKGEGEKTSIDVVLLQSKNGGNATVVNTQTLSQDNNWSYTWSDTVISEWEGDDTVTYTYAVREVNTPAGYSSSISYAFNEETDTITATITNTYDPNCADEEFYMANVLQTEKLAVSKTWDDNDNILELRPGKLLVSVSDGKGGNYSVELNEDNSWRKTLTILKKNGTVFSAREELAGNQYYEQVGEASVVKTEEGVSVSFINKITSKDIIVKKEWHDGWDSETDKRPGSISFKLQYRANQGEQWQDYDVYTLTEEYMLEDNGKTLYWAIKISGLPAGYEYQVVEVNMEDAPYTYEVSKENDTYTITNTLKWKLKKTNMAGDVLSGARFELRDSNNNDLIASGTSEADGFVTWSPADDREGSILYKLDGEYILTETVAPAGYQILQGQWTLTFDKGLLTNATGENGYATYISKDSDAVNGVVVTVKNDELYELPETGGPGIHLYMLGGTLLMMAGALLVYKKRKEEVLRS